jgi:hypothetical protein
MNDSLKIGDRLRIINNDYNPLTEFYLEKFENETCFVNFSYSLFSGKTSYPKRQVSRHPIQKSEFTFSVNISGNECNSDNPTLNDYSKYLVEMNSWALMYRAGLICLKEILNSFTDSQSKKDASEVLIEIMNSSNILEELNNHIVPIIESFPDDFQSSSIIEYQSKVVPVVAIYNSDKKNNNVVTAIFLILFATLMQQVGVLTKDFIIKELK